MRALERARVLSGRRWVKAENVPVGEPVLHPLEVWRARTKREWDSIVRSLWLVVLPLSLVMFLPWGLSGGGLDFTTGLMLALVMGVLLPALMTIGYQITWRRVLVRGVFSGLYENGVVAFYPATSIPVFVPYEIIDEVKLRRINLFQRIPMIQVRGHKHPILLPSYRVLGDDGWDWLRQRISHPPVPVATGPPELHVYGDRGAVRTSVPGTEGRWDGPG